MSLFVILRLIIAFFKRALPLISVCFPITSPYFSVTFSQYIVTLIIFGQFPAICGTSSESTNDFNEIKLICTVSSDEILNPSGRFLIIFWFTTNIIFNNNCIKMLELVCRIINILYFVYALSGCHCTFTKPIKSVQLSSVKRLHL